MSIPSLCVVGGFLGAGKTTLCTTLISYLWDQEFDAALITNDQSSGLVDSEIAAAGGVDVKEIAGGCFCCRCDEFALALDEISALRQADIIIAEAVGSCTDLVATVVEPLRIDLQKPYRILPMTVVVDPSRVESVFASHRSDSELEPDIEYIFLKQLEEAQVILLNKADAVSAEQLASSRKILSDNFPVADVLVISAKDPKHIASYWAYIQSVEPRHRPIQEIDYQRYAHGEALLAWLNAECIIDAKGFGGTSDALCHAVAADIRNRLSEREIEIVHLKVSLRTDVMHDGRSASRALSVVQCVSSSSQLVHVRSNPIPTSVSRMLVNLRAQADPESVAAEVRASFGVLTSTHSVEIKIERFHSFSPGAPSPRYERR